MAASTFLRCFILGVGLPMSQMQAQAGRAIAVARDPITTIEAERLKTSVDLIARDVGLSGLGEIVFTLENRGDVNINEGGKHTNPPKKTISTPPIRIDLYLGGALVQSVYQASLGGDQSHAFAVKPLSNVPNCKDVRAIKIVVDPANVVPELHDDNNTAAVTVARPCPDLAVKSIEREKSGVAGETYRVKVTVINLGNAPAPTFQAWGTAVNSFPGPTGWPEMVPMREIPALAPGETYVFRPGGDQASFTNTWVKIYLDINHHIDELDETNNLVDKKL
jgi:hypothetical protein